MEKDRIIRTEVGPPKQPAVLKHITIIVRLWTIGTLAGRLASGGHFENL